MIIRSANSKLRHSTSNTKRDASFSLNSRTPVSVTSRAGNIEVNRLKFPGLGRKELDCHKYILAEQNMERSGNFQILSFLIHAVLH